MSRLEKYIHLILKMCVNLAPRQKLLIWCPIEASDFAFTVMQAAYAMGAQTVEVCYEDKLFNNVSYLMTVTPLDENCCAWVQSRNDYWVKEGYKMLWLCASDYATLKKFGFDIAHCYSPNMPSIPWVVAYVATPKWAELLYPKLNVTKAVEQLWETIFFACHIDDSDPIKAWQKHIETLHKHLSFLNDYHFKSLHFTTGIGTDLTVDLHDQHRWISCTGKREQGSLYITNLPTEEVFTAPLRTGVNGRVVVSKPLLIGCDKIDGIELTFVDGKVTQLAAQSNQWVLEKLLAEKENACYLGEVALVSKGSPIEQIGIFWYESSFDENASCHLAFGNGYAATIFEAGNKSTAQLMEMGLNQSNIHEDFMIGTLDIKVSGITSDNKHIDIMVNGEWV